MEKYDNKTYRIATWLLGDDQWSFVDEYGGNGVWIIQFSEKPHFLHECKKVVSESWAGSNLFLLSIVVC